MKRIPQYLVMVLASACIVSETDAQSFEHFKAPNGVEFDYIVLTPEGYDPAKSYPTLLAFPPADMDREAVTWAVDSRGRPGQMTGLSSFRQILIKDGGRILLITL